MLKNLSRGYLHLISFGAHLKSILLLSCRLYFGWLFFYAGLEKLQNIDGFIKLLESFSLFAPTLQAYIATFIEIIGGLCLMLGLASRLVAVPLIIVMVTAYATVHLESVKSIFINPSEFVGQAAFNPLLISLFILAFGPGKYSIDYFFEKWFLGVDLE